MTTTGPSVTRPAGEVFPRPRPRPAPALFAGALTLVLGLAIGRFVTYDDGRPERETAPAAAAPTTGPTDLAATVATLEATVQRDPSNATAW